MEVNLKPREDLLLNTFLLMFIIHATQIGVGIVGLPRIVYLDAGHDGWISVFSAGLLTAISLWFMVSMLKQYENADLYGIHVDVFGKWVGNSLNVVYMLYLSFYFFNIYMDYIEIVQVWIFPNLQTWQLAIVLILLSAYAVFGGIRVVVGTAFFSILGTLWMVFVLLVPIKHSEINHLLPIFNTDVKHIFKGVYNSSLSMVGMELIMFVYPFINDKKRIQLYAQIGNLYTTVLYTVITIVSITFFAGDSLKVIIWPVLSMFKVVRIPNLERFEFIAVSFWMLIILPNLCLYLWAASKGFSRIWSKKQKWGVWGISMLAFACSFFIKSRYQMNTVAGIAGMAGFYIAICYPILLSIIVIMKKRFFGRKKVHAETSQV